MKNISKIAAMMVVVMTVPFVAFGQTGGPGGVTCPAGDQICTERDTGTAELARRIHNLEVLTAQLNKKNEALTILVEGTEAGATGESGPSIAERVGITEAKIAAVEKRMSLLERGWNVVQEQVVAAFTTTLHLLSKIIAKLGI